jgi:hypothetical protein
LDKELKDLSNDVAHDILYFLNFKADSAPRTILAALSFMFI